MHNDGLIKNFNSAAPISAHAVVSINSETEVKQASSSSDNLIGVSDLGSNNAGDRVDVIVSGIALVQYGGEVTAGNFLTTDLNGKAVKAATAGQRVIGVATESGVKNDLGSVLLAPGIFAVASAS